jgi:hypothetical protein
MNRFDAVQAAAKARSSLNSEAWAKQIVTAADGDARLAYDFLDTLNAHVTRLLREGRG